jgi:hypothetical protein
MSEARFERDSRCSLGWMRMERRASRRIELRYRDAFVHMSRLGAPHVVDLSAGGMGIILPASQVHELHELCTESIELFLGTDVCVRALAHPVRRHVLESGQVSIGFRLTELTSEGLSLLNRFLLEEAADQEEAFERYWGAKDAVISKQRDHVARVLRLCAEPGAAPLFVFEGRTKLATRLSLCSLDEHGFTALLAHGAPLAPGRRYGLVASGRGAVSAFRAGLRQVNGLELRFALPTELVQSGFRSSARCAVPSDRDCSIGFRHPRSGAWITKSACDVSKTGLSVRIAPSIDLLFPDDQLPNIELCFDGQVATVQGIVRGIHEASPDGTCGIELFDFGSAAQHDTWTEFVFRLAHPRLICSGERAARLGYQVLESSGYVELWSGSQARTLLSEDYSAYWRGDTGATGRVATLLEGAQPVATMAANLLYPRTFMLHHFGVDERARGDRTAFLSYARELYSGMLHELQRFDHLEYVTMYMQADKGFNDFLYGEFARMYREPEALLWANNQVYRADTRRAIPEGPMDRLVRGATDSDLALLESCYARSLPALQIAAHELTAEGLSTLGFAHKLAPHGPVRTRHSYVFAPAGRAVWALVCETGNEGVNLFGLMNRCWLTELVPLGSQEASAARRTLLRRALRHFADAGKRQVVLLEPEGEAHADPLAAGFERVADGVYWLSRREVMPAWLSYVEDAFSLSRSRLRRAA